MNRNKKIVISCLISIVVVIVMNYITNKLFKEEKFNAYVLNQVLLEGEMLSLDKVDKVEINKNYGFINDKDIFIYLEKYVAKEDLKKGQLISKEVLALENKYNDNNDTYVILPITNFKNAGAYQIEKGDKINVYYTSKQSQTEEVIKDYERIYSSNVTDAMVTIKLLEKVSVVNTYYDTGEEAKKGQAFKQIMIKTNMETAQKIANLKEQGVFDICLVD